MASLLLKNHKNALWVFIPVLAFSFLLPKLSSADDVFVVEPAAAQSGASVSAGPYRLEAEVLPQKQAVVQAQGSAAAPDFSAKSVLIYDPVTDVNIFEKNPDQQLPIASLTKLMTALVATESPGYAQPIIVTKDDLVNISPILHLKAGDKVMPEDLVKAMLVGSANDAALTLANHFPDAANFIAAMNQKAQDLGMLHTHFTTPVGFDTPGNYSTADDLKILVDYAVNRLPFPEIWRSKNYSFTSAGGTEYVINNSNSLVFSRTNIFSIKTGATFDARGNMIVLARDDSGRQVITVVLNSGQRETDTLTAVDYIFKNFSWPGN